MCACSQLRAARSTRFPDRAWTLGDPLVGGSPGQVRSTAPRPRFIFDRVSIRAPSACRLGDGRSRRAPAKHLPDARRKGRFGPLDALKKARAEGDQQIAALEAKLAQEKKK
jgi:hypothetical protein